VDRVTWKYGDAAEVRCSDGTYRIALYGKRLGQDAFSFPDGTFRFAAESKARPIEKSDDLTLDPDDKGDVAMLRDALSDAGVPTTHFRVRAALLALRDGKRGTPEPDTDGAVVRAVCDCDEEPRLFVRDSGARFPDAPWKAGCGSHEWDDLRSVEIL
jgi:hypothetical protein